MLLTASVAGIANSVLIFVTFLLTIPAIITPTRSWLKFGSVMVLLCGIFSLVIGLVLWILTLKTKEDFAGLWGSQPAAVQDLMQTRVSVAWAIWCLFYPERRR